MVRLVLPLLVLLLLPARFCLAQSVVGTSSAAPAISLQPGDLLRVQIWREEDLGGEFLVDNSGHVTLPLLGKVRVADMPLQEIPDLLAERYRKELRNPSINVVPLRRVFILGEVNSPGEYTVDPTTSLAGVIAQAHGATGIGDLRRIRVVRGGEVVHDRVAVEKAIHASDIRSGDQIYVPRTPWMVRNTAYVVGIALSLTPLLLRLF